MNVPLFSAADAFKWGFSAGCLFMLAVGAAVYWISGIGKKKDHSRPQQMKGYTTGIDPAEKDP
jgi:hypothetical protein